jgi:hypothetical protein
LRFASERHDFQLRAQQSSSIGVGSAWLALRQVLGGLGGLGGQRSAQVDAF